MRRGAVTTEPNDDYLNNFCAALNSRLSTAIQTKVELVFNFPIYRWSLDQHTVSQACILTNQELTY